MSDTATHQGVRRVTRVRQLGDAVPTIRPFRDNRDDVKIEPKTSEELRADRDARRDAAPMSTSCGVDGCTWSSSGTAGECRKAAAAHRARKHPELTGRKTHRKGGIKFKRRGEDVDPATVAESRRVRQEKDDAARLETINRGRATRGEEPLLEEVAADRLGPDGATSSSSPTTDREDTMENRYNLRRAGRGLAWTIDAALQAVRDFHKATGRAPRQQDTRDEPTGTLPSEAAAKSLFGSWDQMVERAGFDPAPKATSRGKKVVMGVPPEAVVAPTPEPYPEPQPTPAAAPVALRDPIRNADIPYDAEILAGEAAFLRRRADALDEIASGVRKLADLNEERAA
jgi:hypothetical protein